MKQKDKYDVLLEAMKKIAVGRENCGMPLPREVSRQIAREALIKIGDRWQHLRFDTEPVE